MRVIGKIEILDSFHLTGRGLVARGNLIEGIAKIGSKVILDLGNRNISLKIDGVEMIDNISTEEFWVGLLFNYKDGNKKNDLEKVQLPHQVVDIIDEN